jgi:DnaJ homologue, subfamily C, member 28, conserved domain
MTWIERIISEAIERGDLEPGAGVGEPIPDVDKAYDPAWWVKDWIERDRLIGHQERDRAPRREGSRGRRGSS